LNAGEPVLYESHMHTPLCRHAWGEPEQYAQVAVQRGLKGIIVTCHNPMPDGYAQSSRMYEHQFDEYCALVARARKATAGWCDVRLGLECDYAPGFEEFLERQIASQEFHHILGSVHPQVHEYHARYWTGDPRAYQLLYFEHLALAAETGLFDTLSHPDLVKNFTADVWEPEAILDHIGARLDRIARAGTAMELNTSGLQKTIQEVNPGMLILRELVARGIPVVLGADAHTPDRVAADFDRGLTCLEAAGARTVSFFLDRRRREIPIEHARASLAAPLAAAAH
jgi:histidinol-phosphatase (PHP family)